MKKERMEKNPKKNIIELKKDTDAYVPLKNDWSSIEIRDYNWFAHISAIVVFLSLFLFYLKPNTFYSTKWNETKTAIDILNMYTSMY